MFDTLTILQGSTDKIIAGLIGGLAAALFTALFRFVIGWYRAGQNVDGGFHIAATLYTPLDPSNDGQRARYPEAFEDGKTHIQELIWLGGEVPLSGLLTNDYVFRMVVSAMGRAKNAGILLGKMPERAERPMLKQIIGAHNLIPANDIVRVYKAQIGTESDGRIYGISPPTHERYDGSPHRRVLRAMFVADSQLSGGLPPKEKVWFRNSDHSYRYDTVRTIIAEHRQKPERFARCRAWF